MKLWRQLTAGALRAFVVASVLVASLTSMAEAEPAPRVRFTINDSWRYAPGPIEGAERTAFDDGSWEPVSLPHTWNREDALDETLGYRRGTGWYRKSLTLAPGLRGKRIFLSFEGANQIADVWMNGRKAGSHVGGYTAFAFDITDLVRWDGTNALAVRVDNSHHPDVPPLNADFTFFGGIYRDVWLIATEPVHFAVTHYASPGVYVETPEVSAENAQLRVRTIVENRTDRDLAISVVHSVLDAEGSEVLAMRSGFTVEAGRSLPTHATWHQFTRHRLWSPDDPYLYRVRAELYVGETLSDVVDVPLGFRWFDTDPHNGFSLNGEPLRLYGTNRHQDFPGLGTALSDEHHRRDVAIIKGNGFNFLRLAHYPQDTAVLEAADRLGLVVWEEIPIVNLIGMSDAFAENSERMLLEMIHQHYNHPSVVFWGYMNEVMLTKPQPIPDGYYQRIGELARRLDARAKREDPSRLTVMALSREEVPPKDYGVGSISDVLGFNFYFGWYYEELEDLGRFLDEFHTAYPNRPLMVSEYGAGSDERVHTTEPRAFDFSSEYAQLFHRTSFPQIVERPWLAGSAVWNQFDFASEGRNDTKHAINQKGLWFHDRTPKDTAFYYAAFLKDEPTLHLADEWLVRAGSRPEDRLQPVWAYTNAPEVELFVNGFSAGVRKTANRTVMWAAALSNGENHIRAVASAGGARLEDEVIVRYEDRSGDDARANSTIVVAVNAGSHCSYVDGAGVVWEPDRAHVRGSWGYVGGEVAKTHHRIYSTTDDPLFQWSREGAEAYRFDVGAGSYEIEIGFVEWSAAAPGARTFDVSANGHLIASNLDLAREAGRYRAVLRRFPLEVAAGEGISLELRAKSGKPAVAAIKVLRLSALAPRANRQILPDPTALTGP